MKNVIKSALGLGVLALGLSAAPAFAWSPVGLPYQTWGETSYRAFGDDISGSVYQNGLNIKGGIKETFRLDTRFEQGVDILKFGPGNRFTLTPFIGLRLTLSQYDAEGTVNGVGASASSFQGKFGQDFGLKVKYDVPVREGHWGQVALGVRGIHNNHFGDSIAGVTRDNLMGEVFLQWGFGGDWKK